MTRTKFRLAIAAVVAVGSLGALHAQPADSYFSDFVPSGDWILSMDGVDKPAAKIYDSTRSQSLLIMSSDLESPVLLDIAGHTVATLNMLKVAEQPDGRIHLLADAVLAPAGAFDVLDGTSAHFKLGGHDLVLKPHPYLLGLHNGKEVLDSSVGYQWRAKHYEPDAQAIAHLRKEKRDVRILTFFGSWCPHCKEHLPLLLKVEQRVTGSHIKFDYYGLPSGFGNDPEARKWNVQGVPTSIVFLAGKEIGRIPGEGWSNPEIALDLILHPTKVDRQ